MLPSNGDGPLFPRNAEQKARRTVSARFRALYHMLDLGAENAIVAAEASLDAALKQLDEVTEVRA